MAIVTRVWRRNLIAIDAADCKYWTPPRVSDGESERAGVSGACRAATPSRPPSLPRYGQVGKPQLIGVGDMSARHGAVTMQ